MKFYLTISECFLTGNETSKLSNSGDNNLPLPPNLSSVDLKAPFSNDDEPKLAHKQMGNQKDTSRNERKYELVTKNFKDILIRSYPSFVQIIISPVTTGLKHTINVNVCEELIDVMKQLLNIKDCKAILLTGIGSTFCQGNFDIFCKYLNKYFRIIKHYTYKISYLHIRH